MNSVLRYLLQGVCYTVFGVLVLYFSISPPYHYLKQGEAELQLAFRHATQSREPCWERSADELAKLPPNMRRAKSCPRERSPLTVRVDVDGKEVYNHVTKPTGFHRDLSVYLFVQIPVPAGEHKLVVRMNDSVRVEGFNYEHHADIAMKTGQVLVVTLDEETNTFIFK